MRSNRCLCLCLAFLLFLFSVATAADQKKKIVMLISTGDSLAVARAFKTVRDMPRLSERYLFEFYTGMKYEAAR